jgi:filamentous hemagglutinin family protein
MHSDSGEHQGGRFKRFKIASASGLSFLLLFGQTFPAFGNPTGGSVVAGSATIGGSGNTVTINQSSNAAIINWQQFSIAHGETTQFIVPTNTSATLNRVTSGNPSAIYGTLTSNGQLFLINPSGIIVGAGGRIDTNGFLGSTLDVSNDDFMKGGDMHFTGTSDASVENDGVIHATNGDVYLIASQVTNNGSISAPHGNVGLAAGLDVLLQQAGDQHLFINPTSVTSTKATGITNAGKIRAASAELKAAGGNAYALAINNSGVIAATGFKKINGQVYLTSDGGNITNSGKIIAKTSSGNGGNIVLNGYGSSSKGTVLNSGQLIASGKTGGTVEVLGNKVGIMDSGVVDVSGNAGGGTALIGGDEHGANPAIPDADQTYLSPDAKIVADALLTGDGGKVVLWGNQTTQVYGSISAQGGSQSGNGGFVETSAPTLDVRTVPKVGAANGQGGDWLLDPSDVTISDSVVTNNMSTSPSAFTITTSTGGATLYQGDLLTALQSGNVTIDASQGTGASDLGSITWTQTSTAFDITGINNYTLTLDAPQQINLSGISIVKTGATGELNIVLNNNIEGAGSVLIQNSNIVTGGGNITANGNGYTSFSDANYDPNGVDIVNSIVNAQGGSITFNGTGGYTYDAERTPALLAGAGVQLFNGSIVETSGSGNIQITGNYDQTNDGDPLIVPFVSGINIDSDGRANVISAGSGDIILQGEVVQTYGNDSNSSQVAGFEMDSSNVIEAQTGGYISISGNTSDASAYDSGDGNGGIVGVDIGSDDGASGVATVSVAGGTNGIFISGQGGQIFTNSSATEPFNEASTGGVNISNGTQILGEGTAPITIDGVAGSVTVDSGNIEVLAAGISIFNNGKNASNTTSITTDSGNIIMAGTGGTSPNLGIGVIIGGVSVPGGAGKGLASVGSVTGEIDINGTGGEGNSGPGSFTGFYTPNHGIGVINGSTISTGGELIFDGTGSGPSAEGIEITEITDPNFDTSPTLPLIAAHFLALDAVGNTGIQIKGVVDATEAVLYSPNADISWPGLEFGGGATLVNQLEVSDAQNVSIEDDTSVTLLGASVSGEFFLVGASDVTVVDQVSGVGQVNIYAAGNLTLTGNAQIVEQGTAASFGPNSNVGSVLNADGYFINNSTAGANVFQLDSGAVYYVFSKDSSATQLGGLMPDFTITGLTVSQAAASTTPFQAGNGLFYAAAPVTPSNNQMIDNQNQIIAAITPQNNQVAPQQPPPPQGTFNGGFNIVPVSYTGDGISRQSGEWGSDLANSSGNGGSVGAGDTAQLTQGQIDNVTNPAVQSLLNEALSSFVHDSLNNAINAIGDVISSGTDDDNHGKGKHH